jgi:hypothetical protein
VKYFFLGIGKITKNLEENLSMPELIQTLKSMNEREHNAEKVCCITKG